LQLLIYDEQKFETITEAEISLAMDETCGQTFDQVRPEVVQLFAKI
jgi:hypothetical protein